MKHQVPLCCPVSCVVPGQCGLGSCTWCKASKGSSGGLVGREPEASLIDHPAGHPHWLPLSNGLTCLALGPLPQDQPGGLVSSQTDDRAMWCRQE